MDTTLLYSKLAVLPEHLKSEVSDFIDFLISKSKKDKIKHQKEKPSFGSAKGLIIMKDDFDEPLDDFKDYIN